MNHPYRAGATVDLPGALSQACDPDLSSFRPEHLAERVRRTLERESMRSVAELRDRLASDQRLRQRFRRAVAVSFTGILRDPHKFEPLEPHLTRGMRVWSAGSANGSELFTIATMLDQRGLLEGARLVGSDLLAENVAAAREAAYDREPVPERLRAALRFEERDIVRDGPPPRRFDLVLCRNVAIYLTSAARASLHASLVAALARDGLILLGRSERLVDHRRLGLAAAGPCLYRRAS